MTQITLKPSEASQHLNGFNHANNKKGTTTLRANQLIELDDGRRFIIADNHPRYSFWDGGTLYAYQFQPASDHQDLINSKPSELEPLQQTNGRFHGKLIKVQDNDSYAILIGPPAEMIVPSYDKSKPSPKPLVTSVRNAFMR